MPIIGSKILRFETLDSTSNKAKEIAAAIPEGAVVIAEEQSAGRGKPGNFWLSPKGGLYFSAILKPYKNPSDLIPLTLLAAQAVVDTLFALYRIKAEIKLPNDVLVSGKKIAGILTEKMSNAVIVGIGVNINNTDFPPGLCANSVKLETGAEAEIENFFQALLANLDILYSKFLTTRI